MKNNNKTEQNYDLEMYQTISQDIKKYYILTILMLKKKRKKLIENGVNILTHRMVFQLISEITKIPYDMIKKVITSVTLNIIEEFNEDQKIYISELGYIDRLALINYSKLPEDNMDYYETDINIWIILDLCNLIESFKEKKNLRNSLLLQLPVCSEEELDKILQKGDIKKLFNKIVKKFELDSVYNINDIYLATIFEPMTDSEFLQMLEEPLDITEEELTKLYESKDSEYESLVDIFKDIMFALEKYDIIAYEEKFIGKNEITKLTDIARKKIQEYTKTLEICNHDLKFEEKASILQYLNRLVLNTMKIYEKIIYLMEYVKFLKTIVINCAEIDYENDMSFLDIEQYEKRFKSNLKDRKKFEEYDYNISELIDFTDNYNSKILRKIFEIHFFLNTGYINFPEKDIKLYYLDEDSKSKKNFRWIQNSENNTNMYIYEVKIKEYISKIYDNHKEKLMQHMLEMGKFATGEFLDQESSELTSLVSYIENTYEIDKAYIAILEDIITANLITESKINKKAIRNLSEENYYIIENYTIPEKNIVNEKDIKNIIIKANDEIPKYISPIEKLEYEEYGKMNDHMTNQLLKKGMNVVPITDDLDVINNKGESHEFLDDKELSVIKKEMNLSEMPPELRKIFDAGELEKIIEANEKAMSILPKDIRSKIISLTPADLIKNLESDNMSTDPKTNKQQAKEMLKKYSQNLNEKAKEQEIDELIGRDKELERIIEILNRRTKNNPVLIGESGVGKTAIAQGLAQKIVRGEVPEKLIDKQILLLDLTSVVAGTQYRGQFEERMKNIMQNCEILGNVILVIDELHTIVSTGSGSESESTSTAANILKPSLSNGKIQILGTTTLREYKKFIEKDKALERRFQTVIIEEPSKAEAIQILEGIAKYYEKYHNVNIPKNTIEATVQLSSRYISNRFLPDKAIDVLDEACSKKNLEDEKAQEIYKHNKMKLKLKEKIQEIENAKSKLESRNEHYLTMLNDLKEEQFKKISDKMNENNIEIEKKEKEILKKEREISKVDKELSKIQKNYKKLDIEVIDVAKIIENWTKIPVLKLTQAETEKILNLENILSKRVIGQEEAITSIVKAIKRNRVGINSSNRPPSFLFVGPTGVGKTELAKSLSRELFGAENKMVRVDMSEYSEEHSSAKLIGSPPGYIGYDEGGQLTEKIRRSPYSVILFDEIEKAHPKVLNVLLQVLDDGHLTDAQGTVVNFAHTIIIMTSNAGSTLNLNNIGFGNEVEQRKDKTLEGVREVFRPEFLNRFDSIVVFKQLTPENLKSVVSIFISETEKALEKYDIVLNISEKAKEYLVQNGTDLKYGARPLKRAVQKYIEDEIADLILENNYIPSSILEITYNDKTDKLDFNFKAKAKVKEKLK